MELSAAGLFRVKWTEQIQEEWISRLLENRPDLDRTRLERTRALMAAAVPDCLVQEYESLIPSLDLPDPDDRHVLAAAIHCDADVIVTFNLSDFPQEQLARFDLEAQHPDDFIVHQFVGNTAAVVVAAQRCRARLKSPPLSASRYLATLQAQSLPQIVDRLSEFIDVI
jgi:predicted nucleic acid-binding protein